jgi:cytidylate kinase
MNSQAEFDRCLSFINCQLRPNREKDAAAPRYAVTLSRQTGCGALAVGHSLATYLAKRLDNGPWAVFDRNLVERVLDDHHLPKRLAKFMPEDRISEMADTMDELAGLHPPSWVLVRQTAETIFHLAELGNVILIGRGANIITSRLRHVIHTRLVGSLEKRIQRIQTTDHLSPKAALNFITREDRGRKRYLKKYFGRDIADPLLYHLTINTDCIPCSKAAQIIGETLLSRPLENVEQASLLHPLLSTPATARA